MLTGWCPLPSSADEYPAYASGTTTETEATFALMKTSNASAETSGMTPIRARPDHDDAPV